MSRWKTVVVVAAGLGSFLLVKLLAGGFGAVGGTYLVDQFAAGPSAAEIISELRGQGYRMYDVMEQQLPEDYAALTQEMAAIVARRPTAAQARDQAIQATAAIRKKHAKSMHQAPDESLRAALTSQLDLMQLVAARETAASCARFIVSGPAALVGPDKQYLRAFDANAVDVFGAIGAARKNPQPIEAVTDADWEDVGNALIAQGGTSDDLQSLTALDPKDENLCRATIRFFRAVLAVEGPAGRRVRADIAYGLAAN